MALKITDQNSKPRNQNSHKQEFWLISNTFHYRFCVGDRFYLCDNKILCEYDYEERLVFANIAYNPSSLAHIRRQVSSLQVSEYLTSIFLTKKNHFFCKLNTKRRQKIPLKVFHHNHMPFVAVISLYAAIQYIITAQHSGIIINFLINHNHSHEIQ